LTIKFEHISIGFANELFQIQNLELSQGNVYALIGPNGAGKTTFLNTVLGNQKARAGNIHINGEPLGSLKRFDRVRTFAYVPSRIEGMHHLSVRELIGLGRTPFTNVLDVQTANDTSKIDEIIKELSLEDIADKSTTEISDGEKQIVMIAKALVQESKIIVLDEPTAFLDYSNRIKVLSLLQQIVRERGLIVLFSTHNLEVLSDYTDRILAIEKHSKKLIELPNSSTINELVKRVFD
jgi:iron complex transport system ATP-binding protein